MLGAFVAAMLYDTVGPALLATLEPDQFQSTLQLSVSFLRPGSGRPPPEPRGGHGDRKGRFPTMPAYVIVETDVTDPEQYEHYKAAASDAVAAGGGRYLARGGELAVLEGDWQPPRLVILEFEDLAAARRWYDSELYQQARRRREGAAHLRMVAVQGAD